MMHPMHPVYFGSPKISPSHAKE